MSHWLLTGIFRHRTSEGTKAVVFMVRLSTFITKGCSVYRFGSMTEGKMSGTFFILKSRSIWPSALPWNETKIERLNQYIYKYINLSCQLITQFALIINSRKVCIKTRSTPCSLSLKDHVIKHTTVKWVTTVTVNNYIFKKSQKVHECIYILLDVSVWSIALYFYESCPQGESKYKQRVTIYGDTSHRNI